MTPTKKREPMDKEKRKNILRERKKQSKQLLKQKRARLIVKNLPFKANEENLKEHFEKFGEIESVQLLKKEDGKLKGCGFIQFKAVQKAAKARHHTNNKEFLGRKIIVDFAQAKNKYEKEVKKEAIKREEDKPIEIKDEEQDETDKKDLNESLTKEEVNDSDSEKESEDEDSEDENEEKSEDEVNKKPRVISNDISEGKTVFIKNVPFSATKEDLKECMKQFGPVYYALICIDKFTEHSKGTAFVKFVNKEDADKALQAGTELTLQGNVLDCHPALNRNELQKKTAEKNTKEEHKDSRNLYLVKEGVILAGTKAAEGVSASDMAKRLQLEQYKTQMLRNLNMFISKERLIVHNLSSTWDDKKLKILFQKYSPKSAIIKEARIMRNMRNVDAKGIGQSKEYGFVSFTKHEDALHALRALNNNPNIFSAHRRPIVAFSIENKAVIKVRQKRLEKSKQKNPKSKFFNPELVQTGEEVPESKNKKQQKGVKRKIEETEQEEKEFSGIAAKPGVLKMRSRYKLTTQAKMHYENLKKEKKQKKFGKKTLEQKKKEFTKQPKQKVNDSKLNQSDNFSNLVNDYKKKLIEAPAAKKTKWYT